MANWEQFHQIVTSNYHIMEDRGESLTLVFDLNGGRSQLLILQKAGFQASSGDWVTISSPIGKVSDVNLTLALMKVNEYVVGGLTIEGDFLIARHAVPLENADPNEIAEPMRVICMMADRLEASLVGGDQY